MELKKLLIDIPSIMSITGYTMKGGDALRALIGNAFDESYTDEVGNHIFVKRCGKENAPKILIDTHFDEVGMMVTEIHENGFLSVVNVGGLDMRIMQAAEVTVYGEGREIYGVVVSTPPHLTNPSEAKKLKDIGELYIDTGYSKEEIEKYVHLGTPVGFRAIYRELLNDRLSGKAFDCKACGACAAYAVANTPKEELAGDVYVVFSNFEETGARGAGAGNAAYSIDPDYAMVADVTHAVMPGDGKEPKQGEGICMTISPITNRKLINMLVKEAKEKEMNIQRECVTRSTGTNTMTVNLIRGGIPTVDVGLPLKNMHTYNEVVSIKDAQSLSDLMRIFITSKDIAEVFGR